MNAPDRAGDNPAGQTRNDPGGQPERAATDVVLVGLMGSGKSTVGRLVAARLGRPLIDSDTAIEARTGKTVRELWADGGEAAYRQLESDVVLDALADPAPVVIAAPGGVVLDDKVVTALGSAWVVWLRADPSVLAARVRPDDHRPLLGTDPAGVLEQMATERADRYLAVADLVLEVDRVAPEALADRILADLAADAHDA